MEKLIGLWIDRKKAVILILEDKKEKIKQIQSNLERNTRFRWGARMKKPHGVQTFMAEDQEDRRQDEHLKKYYGEVIASVRDAASILVMGPGEAKFEFEKRLIHERIGKKIAVVKSSDKLTERQFAAMVRRYFKERPT